MTQGTVDFGTNGQAILNSIFGDDGAVGFGSGSPGQITWDTSDANANMLKIEVPTGGAVDVPVVLVGIGHIGVDLGFFNGVTQPTLGVADADRDSWLVMDFSGDDTARVRSNRATEIATAAGALTLSPTTDTILADGTGLLVGTTSRVNLGGNAVKTEMLGTAAIDSSIAIARWQSASSAGPALRFAKSRNATIGSFTILNDGDSLGNIVYYTDDGTDMGSQAAAIAAEVDGTPGVDDTPGRLVLSCTPAGSAGATEVIRFTQEGQVLINSTNTNDMTIGLKIDQSTNDDAIFILKSSTDVATGLSTAPPFHVETEDYFLIGKGNSGQGGVHMQAMAEDDTTKIVAALSTWGGTAGTDKTAAGARGLVEIQTNEHNGSNVVSNITADGNVFAIRCRHGGTDKTRFAVDEAGEGHLVVDAHVLLSDEVDDAMMQRAGRILSHPEDHPAAMWDGIKEELGLTRRQIADWFESRKMLYWHRDEETGEPDYDKEVTVAIRNGIMFAWDALWQARQDRAELRGRLESAERKLLALEGA